MNNREMFFRLVRAKESPVLSWIMAFFNVATAQRLIGADNVPADCSPEKEWIYGASSPENIRRKIRYAEATGNFSIGVGRDGSFAFGHGGPGEFCQKLVEQGDNYSITQYETGVLCRTQVAPHFYHNYAHPVTDRESLAKLALPDPCLPERYTGIKEEADIIRQSGYAVHASLNGFYSGLHYFLYPYDKLLEGLLLEPEFIGEMTEKLGAFNLKAAERLLTCGVDMITFCDDLGSGNALMMSPVLYRRFFKPWHARLADQCHRHGAVLHMHSHGNINAIVGDICEAGVDMLNPLDPTEGMDLPALKKRYGNMTFVGGLDRFFFSWGIARQREYLQALAKRAGGGFILMDSGGVPENVTREQFEGIMALFAELKREYE